MEGGEVEYWRIDEQCGLEEEEDEKGIVSKTTRWALKAGLRLGKKVVISGIVVSSAPLVLPPLITICVVGFIVLVPVGVVLGSYACTEKLMSKLLPIPLLEYHSQDGNHQVEEEFGEELYGRVYEGELGLIQEEMKMEGEQRIELVRDNEEESEYVEKHDDKKGIGVDDEHLEEEVYEEEEIVECLEEDDNIDENMEKGGYEEDVEEVLDVNIDENLEDEEGYEEAIGESLEGEHEEDIDDENLDEGYEEDTSEEYLEAEHKVKNEINIDDNLEEGYEEEEAIGIGKYLEGEHEEEDEKEDENLEEGYEEALEGEGEHQEKNEISIDEDLEEGYEEDIGEYLEEENEHDEGPMPEMNLETDDDDEPGLHSEFGENVTRTKGLDLFVATSARTTENHKLGNDEADENLEHKSLTLLPNLGSSSMKEDEEHLEKTRGFEEEEEEEDKKDTPSSKVDNENPLIGTEAKVEIITTVAVVKETQLAPETENKQGNGENRNASEQVSAPEHNEINSNEGAGAPSSEVMVSEEKIWEQLSAIRGILGYTAAPQSSTVDELKALFILTGVEPPSPFEDPSDLADVDEKLRLLMSIVGAK